MMKNKRVKRRSRRHTRQRIFNDTCAAVMNVTENLGSAFRFNNIQLLPSLQSTPRAVSIAKVMVKITPSGQSKAGDFRTNTRVQFYAIDLATNTLVPLTTERPVSIMNPSKHYVRIPSRLQYYLQPTDTRVIFVVVFKTSFPDIASTFQLQADIVSSYKVTPEIPAPVVISPTLLEDSVFNSVARLTIDPDTTSDDDIQVVKTTLDKRSITSKSKR